MGTAKQVIGALGDLGAEILKETAKVPAELTGVKIEGGTPASQPSQSVQPASQGEQTLGKVTGMDNEQIKRSIARAALQELVGEGKPAEPDQWERKQREEDERKRLREREKKEARKRTLPNLSSKPRAGQKYGIFEKTTEAQKNVKAE